MRTVREIQNDIAAIINENRSESGHEIAEMVARYVLRECRDHPDQEARELYKEAEEFFKP